MTSAKQRRLAALAAAGRDRTGRPEHWDETTDYIVYDPQTGVIRQHGRMALAALDALSASLGWAFLPQSGDPSVHYVSLSGEVPKRMVRRACPAVLDGLVLRDLPQPCRIEIADETGDVRAFDEAEAAVALSFSHPGTFTVRVLSVPFTDGAFTIVAPTP